MIKCKIPSEQIKLLGQVLAALILHSFQNYARFTSRFPLFHSRPMQWSEEHDVLFLRENISKKEAPLVDWLGKR